MSDKCIHRHTKKSHPNCFNNEDGLRLLVLPDIHFPKQSKRAYGVVMKYVEDFKPEVVVNLGDLGDFAGVGHWNRQRYKMRKNYPVKRDLDMCYAHHKRLRDISPDADIYTLGGNHDQEWPERYIEDHPEMEGYFDFERDMGFKDFNINYIKRENQPLKIGKVRFVHGWFTGIHHAKKHAEHIHNNIVYGHAHDVQMFTPKNYDPQHRFTSMCIGHLMEEKKAEFLKDQPTNWMLAFAHGYIDKATGDFDLWIVQLPNYRFHGLDGKLYKG